MKAYYLTAIGVILLIISMFVKTEEKSFEVHDTYFITDTTFLLQVSAAVFLLIALILKIVNINRTR